MSYWMVAFTPAALSARNREPMLSNVSFTVAMRRSFRCRAFLESEEVHAPGNGEHGPRDIARALRAQERDCAGDVLGLPLPLHGYPLDHALVQRRQIRVRPHDPGRDHVGRHIV